MTWHFGCEAVASFDALIGSYRACEFDSPYRSTAPLLSLLQHGGEVWRGILGEFGMSNPTVGVHLEYKVEPPCGRGRPSHTDAMLIHQSGRACAVEAKWTEPPYDTVARWLGLGTEGENRRRVLEGWLSLLQPHAARELCVEDFQDVTYQMMHRAASAAAAGGSPSLAYLQFTPEPDGSCSHADRLRVGLRQLAAALSSPASFPIRYVEVELRPTLAFEQVRTLPKGAPTTGEAVRAALLGDEPLFTFPSYRVHHVVGDTFA